MSDTRYRDAEWLEEQYHEKELSQREIADKCDTNGSTVHYWLRKHDIDTRDRLEHLEPNDVRYQDAGWLEEQYHEKGLSQREIANKCGVEKSTVGNWLRKHDIEIRNRTAHMRRTGVGIKDVSGYRVWQDGICNEQVRVHRLLAVAEYGFGAVCDMDVHHKNGIRWDNRPDNIELLTPSEHIRQHNLERHDDGDTRYRDAAWLYEQYHEKELSQREIADKCGVSKQTVYDWMKKHDIESRDRTEHLHSDKPTGQLTLDDTRELEGAQTVNQ